MPALSSDISSVRYLLTPRRADLHPDHELLSTTGMRTVNVDPQEATGGQCAKHVDRKTVSKHERLGAAVRASCEEPECAPRFIAERLHG
jgi:hypothetical protein